MPGYQLEFVSPVSREITCQLCHLPMKAPVILRKCSHHFCDECLQSYLNKGRIVCPQDHAKLDYAEIYPNKQAEAEVMLCIVRCSNRAKGCLWSDRLDKLKDHLQTTCWYELLPCTKGCTTLVARSNMSEHIKFSCPRRTIVCEYCGQNFTYGQLEAHEGHCPFEPLWCESKCGSRMERRLMKNHVQTECSRRKVPCRYCCNEFLWDTLQSHQRSCPRCPTSSNSASGVVAVLRASQNSKHMALDSLDQPTSIRDWRKRLSRELASTDSPQRSSATAAATITSTGVYCSMAEDGPATLENTPAHNEIYRSGDDSVLSDLQLAKALLLKRSAQTGLTVGGDSSHGTSSSRQINQETVTENVSSAHMERSFHVEDEITRIAGGGCCDAGCCRWAGSIVWRVEDFDNKFAEALQRAEYELVSQPFYAGCYGYRMCASMFPAGNGVGSGQFLSVYVRLLPGEYDSLLHWPFLLPVTFTLYDQLEQESQAEEGRRNVVESFQPDPYLPHFRRPQSEKTLGYGFPKLISHALLRSRRYIGRDGTLFIKVQVDLSKGVFP